jgi:hypothetical protein
VSDEKPFRARCPNCAGERNCRVSGLETKSYDDGYSFRIEWRLLKCLGCDEVFFQEKNIDFEDMNYEVDPQSGEEYAEPSITDKYWPAIAKRARPGWLSPYSMDSEIERCLNETYGALEADLPMLAAVGARTCFDIAAIKLGADAADELSEKLNSLLALSKISEADKLRLKVLTEAGGASVHRGWVPTSPQLNTIMDVMEHFIEAHFVKAEVLKKLDAESAALGQKIPPRPKRAKKAKKAKSVQPEVAPLPPPSSSA